MKVRVQVTTKRSRIFFLQSPCKYPCARQIVLIWSSLIYPPEKFQGPNGVPSLAGELTCDGETSIHQHLFQSSMSRSFSSAPGRKDKTLFTCDGGKPLYKLEEGLMELPAIDP